MFQVAGTGSLSHLVLPAATLGTGMAAVLTRLLRASMLEVLDQEYMKTARSKGLPERIVVYKHALRNALLPILTVVGLSFGALLNGTVIVEVVFQRPGLGLMFIEALLNRNYPVVLASVVLAASIFVIVNTIVDVAYRYVDPRIELERRPA
jgi:peptide/nickel transport system permease protein